MAFIRRTAPPTEADAYYYDLNPFYQSGMGLPNCTAYAWGRFYEISGVAPTLSLSDAENWWAHSDGYSRGQSPKLGAVMCWRKGATGDDSDGSGHVAIVEAISSDGTITTSNSAYQSTFWYETTYTAGNYNVNGYTFQGFIYNPFISDTGGTTVLKQPISSNEYLNDEDMHTNALYIYWYLSKKGWSLNAIAGMLGNMQVESRMNPGIWENLDEGNTSGGFGVVQWTPATKLIHWCAENGYPDYTAMNAQLDRIDYEATHEIQWLHTDSYDFSFDEFKHSEAAADYLALAFLTNYEQPADPDQPERGDYALYWYNYLLSTGNIVVGVKRKKMSLIMMFMATKE